MPMTMRTSPTEELDRFMELPAVHLVVILLANIYVLHGNLLHDYKALLKYAKTFYSQEQEAETIMLINLSYNRQLKIEYTLRKKALELHWWESSQLVLTTQVFWSRLSILRRHLPQGHGSFLYLFHELLTLRTTW